MIINKKIKIYLILFILFFIFYFLFIKGGVWKNDNILNRILFLFLSLFIYPYFWYLFFKKLKIQIIGGYVIILVICHLLFFHFFYRNTLRKNLRAANIVIPGVVYEKYSNINSPGRIYYEFYGEDGKLYSGKEICPEGSYRSFEIGDTVLVRYAISDPYLNKVYNFWPASNEINEYRKGKKYKYVNGQYMEVKGNE